jgi:DNA-binding MarR family transcriptional regulator
MPITDVMDPVALADAIRPALLQVTRELRREARSLGLSPEQSALLATIKYAPGIGIRDLAARERISPPAMTKHVDRLERDGLVERVQSADDRRRVGVSLTAAGDRLLRRVRSRRTAWLARRLEGLGENERAALAAAVEPLRKLVPEAERR